MAVVGRTCGEPDEIKKNNHPKNFTALFGEQVFSCPRTASIRTKTNCDLFVLSRRDFDQVRC